MNKLLLIIFYLLLVTGTSACNEKESSIVPKNEKHMRLKITIGNKEFTATLNDSEAARELVKLLPMTVTMDEHNSNEKYYNLPKEIIGKAINPETIHNGDLMLYGSTTLVLFYKTFSTSYSYTKIGHIDNPSGLESAVGTGSVTISFEMTE